MGAALSVVEIEKQQGKIYMPERPYTPFPPSKKGCVGNVCQYFKAKPPSKFTSAVQYFVHGHFY